jgi:hypothetical protein
MTAAAYVLMQELRSGLAGTASARAQVSILRERFLKIGARVIASVRRIVLHFPQAFPYLHSFRRLALRLGPHFSNHKLTLVAHFLEVSSCASKFASAHC